MGSIEYIEFGLVLIMIGGLWGVLHNRYETEKGLGARTIQIIGIVLLIPLIGILSLEDKLEPQTTATIIGAFIGYLLSGIASFDSK